MAANKLLNCYCDHCANHTCATNQLCYAEWRLVKNKDHQHHLQSSPSSSSYSPPPSSSIPTTLRLEKTFNCFKKDDPLLIRTVCNETATNTSHIIRRCCQSSDYCNKKATLLPSESEALNEIQRFLPTSLGFNQHADNNHNQGLLAGLYHKFTEFPIIVQFLGAALLITILLYTFLLLSQGTWGSRRRRAQRTPSPLSRNNQNASSDTNTTTTSTSRAQDLRSLKGVLNRLLFDLGFRKKQKRGVASKNGIKTLTANERTVSGGGSDSRLGHSSISANLMRPNYGEECSEGSGRANHDTIGYDTNSMASHEPLLRPTKRRPESPLTLMHAHHHQGSFSNRETTDGKPPPSTVQTTLGSVNDTSLQESSSGSGAGQPYLTQRSISHDIQLVEVVGRGFFGVVWRGEYKGEPVAVKIFSPIAEPSWERETDIYQTTMLRHKNILGFIATDKRQDALLSGYWLVTDYYPMGSLYDFLRDNSMSMSDALRMAFSIANGLSHLHIEIHGTKDLGMAVRYNSTTGIVDVPTNSRIGTRRYLAPEILDHKLNLYDFESVKAADIYAFGLVLWEVLRKTCLLPTSARMERDFPRCIEQQYVARMSPAGSPARNVSTESVSSNSYVSPPQQADRTSPTTPICKGLAKVEDVESGPNLTVPNELQQQSRATSEVTQQPSQQQPSQGLTPTNQPQGPMINGGSPLRGPTLEEAINEVAFICDQYEPPYHQYVSSDPSTEEMYQVVCLRRLRPELMSRWDTFSSMHEFVTVMTECWYEKPQARLSALRVRKSLSEIAKKYFNVNMEYD